MPKKMKLQLDDLKVRSFITSVADEQGQKIKGGITNSGLCTCRICTNYQGCPPGQTDDCSPPSDGCGGSEGWSCTCSLGVPITDCSLVFC